MKRVQAKAAHTIPSRPPLRVSAGEQVWAGERDTEWPEFVFVTSVNGTGWVPGRHLSNPTGSSVVQTEYDTTELATRTGEMLDVLLEDLVSGWLWCRSMTGRQGWVPVKTIRQIS